MADTELQLLLAEDSEPASSTDYSAAAQRELLRLHRLREWIDNKFEKEKKKNPQAAHRQPFIAEFAGMPKAGKSGTIEQVRHFFSHGMKVRAKSGIDETPTASYQVHTPAEGVSLRTPKVLKENLTAYNTWAGAYALQELLQAQADTFHDLVLLDRGPWDAGCWLEYVLQNRPNDFAGASEIDRKSITAFFQLPHWSKQADLHVVLLVKPEQAAEREAKQRLIAHGGPAADTELMGVMRAIYEERFERLQTAKDKECPLVRGYSTLRIDTTDIDRRGVALRVISGILDFVERQMDVATPDGLITEEEVWGYVEPFAEQFVRGDEVATIKRGLPEFVARARLARDQVKVRDQVKTAFKPLGNDVVVLSARAEAKVVLGKLADIAKRLS